MDRELKENLIKIICSGVLFVVALLIPLEGYWKIAAFMIPYLIVAAEVLWKALKNIFKGEIFDECFLMSIATIGAWVLGDYAEAVVVMLFYQIGEFFQDLSVDRSKKSITDLMDLRPDSAVLLRDDCEIKVAPEEVCVGDIILVRPGEKVALDGVITEGCSSVNTSALTGESMPRDVQPGSDVLSGFVNLSGVLKVKVVREFGESTVSKILDMVENSAEKKTRSENFITRFAKIYTPAVVISAVVLAILPPLILNEPFAEWVRRALMFLVVSCPCALVISVPLSFFGGIGGASKKGILVKGSNYLENLAKVETVVFDKTGTLTEGRFAVSDILPAPAWAGRENEILKYAAYAESYSNHPVAESLKKAFGQMETGKITECCEVAGRGVTGLLEGHRIYAGNEKYMQEQNISYLKADETGTCIYVAVDGEYAGAVIVKDCIKKDAKATVAGLKNCGVKRLVMLTGDNCGVAEKVGAELGISEVYSRLLPGDKADKVEALKQEGTPKSKVVFVGDGINDAPVLTCADVGIAMGAMGSDAAIEAADVVLMDDMPSKIVTAVKIARKTLRIVRENIVFALTVKILILILSVLGIGNMWIAVFADVGVSFIAIINAMRAMRIT